MENAGAVGVCGFNELKLFKRTFHFDGELSTNRSAAAIFFLTDNNASDDVNGSRPFYFHTVQLV